MALFGGDVQDGTGPILLDDLSCRGIEPRLVDCPHPPLGTHNCAHSEDAGVRCMSTTLVPGMYPYITTKFRWNRSGTTGPMFSS